jgi:hypothetical protein
MRTEAYSQSRGLDVLSRIFHLRPKPRPELAVRANGDFSLTKKGRLAHELVVVDMTLKNNADPQVEFSMNNVHEFEVRKENLCKVLGISNDEKSREIEIQEYSVYLKRIGFPHYKVIK